MPQFVELPEECKDLQYSNLLCGVIRGALEMVTSTPSKCQAPPANCALTACLACHQVCIKVECRFVKDTLKGDDQSEIRVRLIELMQDDFAPDSD